MPHQADRRRVLDGYINESKLAADLNRSVVLLRLWRRQGKGPAWVRVGKTPYYKVETVRRWIDAQERRTQR